MSNRKKQRKTGNRRDLLIEPRWVVGFEVVLGAHLPPSMAARSPVSMVSVSMVMDSSER